MKNRIKEIREMFGESQASFAERISVTRSAVCKMEKGENSPSEQTINLICREFSINETWLRTGQGEMKREMTREQQIMDFASGFYDENDDSFKKRFVLALTKLNSKQWEQLNDIIKTLIEN